MDNRNKMIHGMTDVDNKTHESNLVPGNESEVVDLKNDALGRQRSPRLHEFDSRGGLRAGCRIGTI